MSFAPHKGRRLSSLVFALALLGSAAAADAGTWGQEYDISDGDVNETSTGLNTQHFAVVTDTNDLYIAFHDSRNKVGNDLNYEIYIRRFIYNFGSPSITRVTNAPNWSTNAALATHNWGEGDNATAADSGRLYIAWQDSRLFPIPAAGSPVSSTIYFRAFMSMNGSGFGPEFQVSPLDSINPSTSVSLACGDSSRVWLFWQQGANAGVSSNINYAVYHADTRTMSAAQTLVTGAAFATNPACAATRDGVVHLVWADNRTGRTQLWTKRFIPGSGWTADQQLVFSSAVANFPSISATYTGHVHLVWRDNRDANNEIYYKEYNPATGWDAVDTRLTTNSFNQLDPQVDADAMNDVYVVWSDQRNGASNQDIFYRHRHAGTWDTELDLVGPADTTNQIQEKAGIAHDEFGNSYATWTDYRLPASSGRNKDVWYKQGTQIVTAVEGTPAPWGSPLLRNYPNPFNPETTVQFRLSHDAQTSLRVYDVHGRLVRTLLDSYLAAGFRTVTWDGKDDGGRPVASGSYFLRLQGGGTYLSRTVNLIK